MVDGVYNWLDHAFNLRTYPLSAHGIWDVHLSRCNRKIHKIKLLSTFLYVIAFSHTKQFDALFGAV